MDTGEEEIRGLKLSGEWSSCALSRVCGLPRNMWFLHDDS